MDQPDLNFVSDQNQILDILIRCKEDGKSVGVLSDRLGPAMLITGVEEILFDASIVIVFRHFDHTGYILPCQKIELADIISVCPLTSKFRNPYLGNIDKERNWFF